MASRFSSSKGPSQRQLRAGELVRHALVEIFQRGDLKNELLSRTSVTVSEVRASPDLKQATVFCAPLGQTIDSQGSAAVIDALNAAAPAIRRLFGGKIELKFTPALKFQLDDSFTEAKRIDELLARPDVKRDLG